MLLADRYRAQLAEENFPVSIFRNKEEFQYNLNLAVSKNK